MWISWLAAYGLAKVAIIACALSRSEMKKASLDVTRQWPLPRHYLFPELFRAILVAPPKSHLRLLPSDHERLSGLAIGSCG